MHTEICFIISRPCTRRIWSWGSFWSTSTWTICSSSEWATVMATSILTAAPLLIGELLASMSEFLFLPIYTLSNERTGKGNNQNKRLRRLNAPRASAGLLVGMTAPLQAKRSGQHAGLPWVFSDIKRVQISPERFKIYSQEVELLMGMILTQLLIQSPSTKSTNVSLRLILTTKPSICSH